MGDLKDKFAYTSVNINKNYAGRLHRDANNCGPSFIKAFGKFTGGELNYWPSDDKKLPLEDFDLKHKVTADIKENLMLFDGNRGHFVNKFRGERYSLVFFSIRTWTKIPKQDAKEGARYGIPLPTKSDMSFMQSLLGPTGKEGYRLYPKCGLKRKADTTPPKQADPRKHKIARSAKLGGK